jgi:hypothetical protein
MDGLEHANHPAKYAREYWRSSHLRDPTMESYGPNSFTDYYVNINKYSILAVIYVNKQVSETD